MTKDDYIFYEYNHKYCSAKVFMIFYLGGKSMDLNEFYQSMNVDFHIVLQRLLRKNLILKYFQMFLNDDSFAKSDITIDKVTIHLHYIYLDNDDKVKTHSFHC